MAKSDDKFGKDISRTDASKGVKFEIDEEQTKRVYETLKKKLKSFRKHRSNNYEAEWDKWERIIRGEYRNSVQMDRESRNEREKSKVYYKITNQKRLSAIAQIRDAKPNGDKLPIDLQPPTVNKTDDEQDIDQTIKMMNLGEDYMIDKHRKAIDDHLTFSKSNTEFNKVIDDMCMYGSGVFISPYVYEDYDFEYTAKITGEPPPIENNQGEITEKGKQDMAKWIKGNVFPSRKLKKEIRVGVKHIPLRDFFPDSSCLGDAQRGMGHFVREYFSVKTIMEEVDKGNFDKEVALNLLKRHEEREQDDFGSFEERSENSSSTSTKYNNDIFKGIPLYTYYGDILAKDYKLIEDKSDDYSGSKSDTGEEDTDNQLKDYETIQVQIVMSEDQGILKARKNPYPTQRRPIHIIPWEDVSDEWCGRGLPEKLEDLQRALNTTINVWIDNGELAGSVVLGVNIKDLDEDEDMDIYGGKIIYTKGDKSIRDIIEQFDIRDASQGLINTIGQLMAMIDHESGVPKIIEGQGDVNAKTAYETQQQEAHALKQLGVVIDNIDIGLCLAGEMINEHIIIYEAKDHDFFGDYRVVARGYATFEQKRVNMGELSMGIQDYLTQEKAQPILNGAEMMREKYRLMSPYFLRFVHTDEEIKENQAKIQEQVQAQQQAELEKEQAKIQGAIQLEQARQQGRQGETQVKAEIEQIKIESDMAKQDKDHQHDGKKQDKDLDFQREKLAVDIEESQDDRDMRRIDMADRMNDKKEVSKSDG